MRSDSDLHEPRTDAEQSETGGDLRVSYESQAVLFNPAGDTIVALTGPIYCQLESLRRGIKMGRPLWPAGEFVYFVGAAERFVKIGYTSNLTSRVCDLQGANPMPLRVLAYVGGDRALEREYHRRFASARHFYEWFNLTPEIEQEIARISAPNGSWNIG
jgi:hypothetical protein